MPLPAISAPVPLPHEREHEQMGATHRTPSAASADATTNPDQIQMDDAPLLKAKDAAIAASHTAEEQR